MREMIRAVCLMGALLLAPGAATAAPLAAYGKLPTLEGAAVSSSGRGLAVVVTNGEQRTIVVKDLATGQIRLRGLVGDHKIRNVQWAGEDKLVVIASTTRNNLDIENGRREWFYGRLIDLKTKKLTALLANAESDLPVIAGIPFVRSFQGEPNLFVEGVVFQQGYGRVSLFRIDLKSGGNRLVQVGAPATIDWVVDSQGRPLAQEVFNGPRWSVLARTESGWREIIGADVNIDPPDLVGLGRDDASLIYASPDEKGVWMWREIRTDDRPPAAPIPMAAVQQPIRAAHDGRMIGIASIRGDEQRYEFFDPADQKAWSVIASTFPGARVQLESWSTDRNKVVVRVDSPVNGPALAIVDVAARSAEWLGGEYADLMPEDISRREAFRFAAADGLALSGYLTLPNGRPAKGLPLIVLAHGGPAARDEPGFDWWAQAVASRGYAVLQVNFRGSRGLGGSLLEAGWGQWGRKMQTDLSDGVRALAAKGVIDPKRVCIMGASYGGYASLAGATLDRGVYRCAVAISAPSDLRKLMASRLHDYTRSATAYWARFMGVDGSADERLDQISPAYLADKVDIPILLIHGKDDTVVPLEQTTAMADALKAAGKPYEILIQDGEDHWLSRGATRLEMLTAAMAFVEKNNPPN